MGDACVITHTTATPVDDAIDPLTLKPVASSGETPTTVYTGKCFLSPSVATDVKPEGAPVELGGYTVVLPWDAPLPSPGDTVTVTAAVDPAMVDMVLTILSTEVASLDLARVMHAQSLTALQPLHGR